MNKELKDKIRKLNMYYDSVAFLAETPLSDGITAHEAKVELLEALFFDKLGPKTAAEIHEKLSEQVVPLVAPTLSFPPTLDELLAMAAFLLLDAETGAPAVPAPEPPCTVYYKLTGEEGAENPTLGKSILYDKSLHDMIIPPLAGSDKLPEGKDMLFAQISSDITSPQIQGASILESYLNYIPNIERSRCVPFLKLRFISTSDADEGEPITVIKFFTEEPSAKDKEDPPKRSFRSADILFTSGSKREEGNFLPDGGTVHGMEMFTMPQSLISSTSTYGDPFRPLMSLNGADINITPAHQGFISFKDARIKLTLYDRTKLKDISFLLDPGRFGDTMIEMEAGWSHPDPTSIYGAVINEMKIKDLYQVYKSDFSLNGDSTLDITISVAAVGGKELISKSAFIEGKSDIKEAYKKITDVLSKYKKLAAKLNGTLPTTKHVLPVSILDDDSTKAVIKMDAEKLKKVTETLANFTAEPDTNGITQADADELKKDIKSLVEGDLTSYNAEVTALQSKFKKDIDSIEDYFLRESFLTPGTTKSSTHISFGALFINVAALPFLNSKTVGEVQTMMYNFNAYAGELGYSEMEGQTHKDNISTFALKKTDLFEAFDKILIEKFKLTIHDVLDYSRKKMTSKLDPQFGVVAGASGAKKLSPADEHQKNYKALVDKIEEQEGLKLKISSVQPAPDGATYYAEPTATTKRAAYDTSIAELNTKKDEIRNSLDKLITDGEADLLSKMGTSKLSMPDLKYHVETVKKEGLKAIDSILRFHVYDGNEKPYEMQEIASTMTEDIVRVQNDEGPAESPKEQFFQKLLAGKIIKLVEKPEGSTDKNDKYRIEGRNLDVKGVIKSSMPSITYGTAATAINSVNFSSISDKNINTHFMLETQKDKKESDGKPAKTETKSPAENEAKKIYPITLDIDMLGCPILEYGQQIYVDFGTETDIDNVYGIIGLVHSLTPGSFKTKVKLTPTWSGQLLSFKDMIADAIAMHERTLVKVPDPPEPAAEFPPTSLP